MNIHKNARLRPIGRERLVRQVESGQTPQAAVLAPGPGFSLRAELKCRRL